MEGRHIIDPFAVIAAFTSYILVKIRNDLGVRVDTDRIGEYPCEACGGRARQARANPGLDYLNIERLKANPTSFANYDELKRAMTVAQ